MKGGIRGEKPLTSEFGRPNSVLAATQDNGLVLSVGYDCPQNTTGRKRESRRSLLLPVVVM